ncbi:MAG: rod shape-determining protein RodA [Bdellovibrionaceae bacterium]|nr:rod shape-determining protein RodA [Pseudobdellovibrionaceae bacterium]
MNTLESGLNLEERTLWRRLDLNLIMVVFALNVVGLVNLFSATHGPTQVGTDGLFINQIIWLIAGWSVFGILTVVDYSLLKKLAPIVYILNFVALIYVMFFGKIALGAQRWIDLGFFRYQPSETMKLALILLLARVLASRPTLGGGMGFKELLLPLLLILIPFVVIAEQPDLGTAMTLALVGATMIFFVRVKKVIMIGAAVIALAGAVFSWHFLLHDYQKHRVITFLDPGIDPRGKGYNSIQSKIAVGSGKLFGKGFRRGTQAQLEFLPERHTDFIFSVLSEEHGFVGSVLTITLFGLLFVFMLRVAANSRDKFGALLVVGVFAYVFWHMAINIGMVIGLLPIVGVPLPLLSYGGSGMLTTMAGLGIVSGVAFKRFLF